MTIDWWTLGLEAINVAVLVWLLQRFFWKPVSAMLDARRAEAMDDLNRAAAKRVEADKVLASVNQERSGIERERESILAKAAVEAERERSRRIEGVAKEIDVLRSAHQEAAAKEKAEATKVMQDQAASLAVDIAARLLARIDTDSIESGFLDALRKQIMSLPSTRRQALAGQPMKLISASALTNPEQSQCRRILGSAFETEVDLTFAIDPKLIAGFLLDTPNVVIANNWRDDLNRIRAELKND
ncbi:MAG: F0F1 ATP synthase subunit delta [Hyphomicrobium sp.]|uniref:F0F1 ATP synthase subunit delta n=1 Tax=Hyphomicrobium sp. TaxID=82 RepID=UPI0039E53BA1